MKTRQGPAAVVLLLVPLVLALSSGFVPLSTGLRIASYNIRSGSGMDDVYNLSRTAEAIRLMNVDIVGLQEVDNNTDRHPHDNQAQVLANLTGLTHHVFAKFRDFENGGYGVAIISRFPIETAVTLHYSKPSMFGAVTPKAKVCEVPFEGDYCQGAIAIKVDTGSQKIWFGTTTLGIGFKGAVQAEEAKQLTKFLANLPPANPSGQDYVIITGDFNSDPTSEAIGNMLKGDQIELTDSWPHCSYGNGFTFNSANPTERIDYAFYAARGSSNDKVTCRAGVRNTQASDHRPLYVSYPLL